MYLRFDDLFGVCFLILGLAGWVGGVRVAFVA